MPLSPSDFEDEFERAVAAYADPGDAGYPKVLAARVVVEINARRRKRRWWLGVAVTLPALACLLVVGLLHWRRSEPQHRTVEVASVPLTAPSVTAAPKAALSGRTHMNGGGMRRTIMQNRRQQLPKLDQFLAPTAPTEQERQLMEFAAQASPDTQKLIAQVQKEPDTPLRITELKIPFLDSSTQP